MVYRPPTSKKNKQSPATFLQDISSLIERLLSTNQRIFLVGDFNLHVDNIQNHSSATFLETLDAFGLVNHVTTPTHRSNHTLDLLISRKDEKLVSNVTTADSLPSDHSIVMCCLQTARPAAIYKITRSRSLKTINLDDLRHDVETSELVQNPSDGTNELSAQFYRVLRAILDDHAPEKERKVILRPHAPWYSEALQKMKRERRRCERKMIKSSLQVDKDIYQTKCKVYNEQINQAKNQYIQAKISDCDQKDLFHVVRQLTSPVHAHILPQHECSAQLANRFADYFQEKIKHLRDDLNHVIHNDLSVDILETYQSSMLEFDITTEDEILTILKSTSTSSCDLDPMPVPLLKKCLSELLPVPLLKKCLSELLPDD